MAAERRIGRWGVNVGGTIDRDEGEWSVTKFPNPFLRITRWWKSHDTVDGRKEQSPAARQARFQAEINRFGRRF